MHVLVLGDPAAPSLSVLNEASPGVHFHVGLDPDALRPHAAHAEAVLLCMGSSEFLRPLWPHLPRLRWVHSLSAGVEQVLFPELMDSPIPLTNARGVYAESLGEFVVLGMLYFAKQVRRLVDNQRQQRWERFTVAELTGRTLLIVGYGMIGQAAARRARALGMQVIGVRNRGISNDGIAHQVHRVSELPRLLPEADVVLGCLPATPQTRYLFDATAFRAMKPGALFINVGRGQSVDERALVDALGRGQLGGAALDVFEEEPLPTGHPLWSLPNVLISPHCADQTDRWLHDSTRLFVENLERLRRGEPLLNTVDKQQGY